MGPNPYRKNVDSDIISIDATQLLWHMQYFISGLMAMGKSPGSHYFLQLCYVVDMHLIWRSGIRRFHLRMPNLQMSCNHVVKISNPFDDRAPVDEHRRIPRSSRLHRLHLKIMWYLYKSSNIGRQGNIPYWNGALVLYHYHGGEMAFAGE